MDAGPKKKGKKILDSKANITPGATKETFPKKSEHKGGSSTPKKIVYILYVRKETLQKENRETLTQQEPTTPAVNGSTGKRPGKLPMPTDVESRAMRHPSLQGKVNKKESFY